MNTVSQSDDNGVATNSLLFVSEMAKTVNVDQDQLRLNLTEKLMSRSAAITNEYEHHIVNSVSDSIQRYQNLTKEIHINQRLTDAEKSRLLQLFSPPYKLNFSKAASDIGAHLFYRSLNEIATYRCYDLLGVNEKISPGYDVLIKEVGASVPKLIKYNREYVHACTPNLSLDDTIRLANTARTLDTYIVEGRGTSKQRHLAKRFTNDPIYRCYNKSEYCFIKAKYIVFAHSSYDCSLKSVANMMDASNAYRAIGFIHFSPKILSNLTGGRDNGLNWKLEYKQLSIYGENYKPKYYIVFWFDNDYQNSYVHDLDTYLGIVKHSICTSRKGNTYIIQRLEEIGGLLFYTIIKPLHTIPNSYVIRNIPFGEPEHIIVHYYDLQNDPSKYHYHELIPVRLVVHRKYFEKLYYYLQCLPEGKFTTQNAMIMASTMASRTIVNGMYVSQPYDMDIDLIDRIAYATYFIVYCRRYDFMKVLQKLKNFEDIKRNPTLLNRMSILFRRAKNFVFSSNFEDYKEEKEFQDLLSNCTATIDNDFHTKHSFNILQWVLKLFRINNRYNVKFIPITRVVSIEEDIETIKIVTTSLPRIAPDYDNSDIKTAIAENLRITRIDADVCDIIESHRCDANLIEIPNVYESHCVLLCFCNRHNIKLSELQNILLNSEYYTRLPVKYSIKNSIIGKTAEIRLFELIACVLNVNMCIHFEHTCTQYNVHASTTYHFKVTDNHCTELRERIPFSPVDFPLASISRPRENFPDISTVSKTDKFKMNRVVVDSFSPYVCRSVLKLHEIDANYGVLFPGNICELSCAPGSWIQYSKNVCSTSKFYYSHFIDGLDLTMDTDDMTCLNDLYDGDLTKPDSLTEIGNNIERHNGMDIILSDAVIMMENEDVVDEVKFRQYQDDFFNNLVNWLKPNGNIIFKSFSQLDVSEDVNKVLNHFAEVIFCKPNTSRPISTEYYIVAKRFNADVEIDIMKDYSATPCAIFAKAVTAAKSALKKRFPSQINYVMPFLQIPCSAPPAEVEIIEEDNAEEEDEESPEDPVECDTFETRVIKQLNKLEFSPLLVNNGIIEHEQICDVNPDVHISCYDTPLIADELTDHIVYDLPLLRIDLSTVKLHDLLAHISFVAIKVATFKLRVLFDLSSIQDVNVIKKIKAHVINQFAPSEPSIPNRHELVFIAPPVDCTFSISDYEKSIIEYCTYFRTLRASNTNQYSHLYRMLRNNSFNVTHSFKANVVVNTQHLSILMGSTYQFRHPSIRESYTHAYDGENNTFVPFAECASNPSRYYLVGEFTHKMFDQKLVEIVSAVDVNTLKDVQFVLIQGVAGHGKTREIVEKHEPCIKSSPLGDLVIAPTTAGIEVLISRTMSHYKLDSNVLDKRCYRTTTSYLLNHHSRRSYSAVYIDEAIMMHFAQILAVASYSKAKRVYLYGDVTQIPFHSALGDYELKKHSPQSVLSAKAVRNKSYRIPADVACALHEEYLKCHKSFGYDMGIKTASTVMRSMKVVKLGGISQMLEFYNPNVKYLTFTHTASNDLMKLDPKFQPSTIASYQGSEHPDIAIVRTSISEADPMYNIINICVTALTRHTKSLTYYTMCDKDDFISKCIRYTEQCTDLNIRSYSTSENIGSFAPDIVPVSTSGVTTKFFQSRQKLTSSYTLVDHRTLKTEREFALNLTRIKNDIFVDKSIFKKFTMSDILKWVKKLAPHVKKIYVRTHGESFENDPKIHEIVEEYKCRNAVTTTVAEKLEAVVQPYIPEEIRLSNFIKVSPTVEMLQVFMTHLFPNSVFVSNQFDAYFVATNDVNYTFENVSFSYHWDRYTPSPYVGMRCAISTPAPAVRPESQREIGFGVMKRNENAPKLTENTCDEDVACHLLQNFKKMLIPESRLVLEDMEPITPTTESIVSWLERQDRNVLKAIIHDIPIQLQSLTDCSLSLKRHPKVRITANAIDIYDSVQTITCHPKFVNAYFCSVVDSAQTRLMKLMLPYFKFFTKSTTEQFGIDCYDVWKDYGRLFLFSGDDSLLIHGTKYREMDMSKFDKSQLNFALLFLCKLFKYLGVPDYITCLYYEMMYYRLCRNVNNKFTVKLTPQMESGSAATYFGNTCFCAAVVLSTLDLDDFRYTPRIEKYSIMFNLEVKEFKYDNPYFCSKFVVIDENQIKFYPDPVKILIKLGRVDLKNPGHVHEFHISLKDLVSQYDSLLDISVISAGVRERYGFPYDCTCHIQNLISVILDDSTFSSLYYTLPGDNLDLSACKYVKD
uniref:Alphavirus-like MT domain-containing protein n=1 Tax=Wallerfield virus TaxID=1457165 RepID=A0A8E4C4N0_9VIRU|nr:hypothetical protein 1 [Wallerfield virus]